MSTTRNTTKYTGFYKVYDAEQKEYFLTSKGGRYVKSPFSGRLIDRFSEDEDVIRFVVSTQALIDDEKE